MNDNVTIIGFDLGHGDTALASTRLATTDEPKMLSVNGTKTIPTIVGRHRDGRIMIGEVSGTAAADLVESYERFKSADISETSRSARATRLFVRGIVDALNSQKQIDDLGNSRCLVGHPSGWSAQVVEHYKAILLDCGLPNVDVIPESRAALLHARESGELHLSMEELSRNVLIIDFGSSTTDFTAALGLATRPLDFGHIALGAGIIDGLIMQRMTEMSDQPAALQAALARLPGRATEFAHKCRMVKERYFNLEKTDPAPVVEDIVRIDRGLSVDIALTRSVMHSILATPSNALDGSSWRGALDDCLTKCHQHVGDPDLVIMTGGAARMGFVRDAVQAVFSRSRTALSQEPEFAIAKGLALYGRLMLKTTAFRRVIDDVIQTPEFADIINDRLPVLIKRQAAAVADSLAESAVRPAIVAWRDNASDVRTIDQIGQRIIRDCALWTQGNEAQAVIAGVVVDWLETIRIRLEILTDPICERFAIPKRALSLKGQVLFDPSEKLIATPDVIGNVTIVQTTASAIAAIMVAKILLTLNILLTTHPVGWAVAIIISVVTAVAGVEASKKLLQGVAIPGFMRRILLSGTKIDQMVAQAADKIREQLEQELGRNEAAAPQGEKLADKLRTQIGIAIRHRADDAILLLR